MSGCGGERKPVQTQVPPAPTIETPPAHPDNATVLPAPSTIVPAHPRVLYTETGWASWYGPHYDRRTGANGEVYDMNGMTAAHRTLPLNSIVLVTNIKTGESAVLRITDRGPFVNDRIIDLSRTAAQKLGVYRPGTAEVKIEVLESPAPIETGGRWCVQIGAFKNHEDAAKLKEKLTRRYQTAKVLQFTSPIGEDWLRVRVAQDDKQRAQALIEETKTEAGMYLVRLD